MSKELKPCPFCGNDAEILELEYKEQQKVYGIRCKSCFCKTGYYTSKSGVREAWNRRANNGKID